MPLSYLISERANNQCELCKSSDSLHTHTVSPKLGDQADEIVVLCTKCDLALDKMDMSDQNHWRCLNESIWSSIPAVQVLSYRLLNSISAGWAREILEMAYLDDDLIAWANETEDKVIHKDTNGNILQAGDTVTLIQDLNVKGASFTAKRGTAVRKIRLVTDNPEHIEGKVDGQQIVILTRYVKKST
jgi:protein PhnA